MKTSLKTWLSLSGAVCASMGLSIDAFGQVLTGPRTYNFSDLNAFTNTDWGHQNWNLTPGGSYTNLLGAPNVPTVSGNTLTLGGITAFGSAINNNAGGGGLNGVGDWYGNSIVTTQSFAGNLSWKITVDRISLGAFAGGPGYSGLAYNNSGGNYTNNFNNVYRSALTLVQSPMVPTPATTSGNGTGVSLSSSFFMFAQDLGENGWEVNYNTGGRGTYLTNLDGVPSVAGTHLQPTSSLGTNAGSVDMQIDYTPVDATHAGFKVLLSTDGGVTWILGESVTNSWNTTTNFQLLLSAMAKQDISAANPDGVTAVFGPLTAVPEPGVESLLVLGGAGLGLMRWLARRKPANPQA